MSQKFVAYYRVSTDKQGRSGLGLEAQREAVQRHVAAVGGELVAEFIEVESGKRHDNRPQLAAAMQAARKAKSVLAIAKLDRLARSVAFISTLMESKVEFVACDMPAANRLTLHIMAAFAEHEREMASNRTKDSLRAKRARGEVVGNVVSFDAVAAKGRSVVAANADRRAANVWPVIQQIKSAGMTSYRMIAAELDRRGIETARGGTWSAAGVRNIILRMTERDEAA